MRVLLVLFCVLTVTTSVSAGGAWVLRCAPTERPVSR